MKGMEMPINMLVIIAIAAAILLIVMAMVMMGINPIKTTLGYDAAKNAGCRLLLQDNCDTSPEMINVNIDIAPIDAKDGMICKLEDVAAGEKCYGHEADTLQTLAEANYGCATGDIACTKRLCSCPGYYSTD